MKSFFTTLALGTLISMASALPSNISNQCDGWSVAPLEHTSGVQDAFAAKNKVTLKWSIDNSKVKYIREIDLVSAKSGEFLHTQLRRYPGLEATDEQVSFTLSVPLCLQREGEYYLEVFASTPGNEADCSLRTPTFKITPDPNGDYSICESQ
ncbi:hypothetical protein K7432_004016 [Basidiobolus ranarum]|uniref:Uncharacterized protein n=1 Tax=Basidiobolus ranarum TaxID=34480 RepID=A0ABR2WYX6_9FUNG